MTKEAMKLAIKALNTPRPSDSYPPLWRTYENTINTAIKALEEALKQEQEYEVLAGIGKGVEIPAGWKYYYIKPKLPLQQKQEQDEPVAYVNDQYSRDGYNDEISKLLPVGTYLYTKPQQRKPLTFEQVEDCFGDGATAEENGILVSAQWLHDFARAIESAHGIKE